MAEPQGISAPVHPTVEALIRHRLGEALGGLRGSLEAALPMLLFVIVWSATRDRTLSLGAAAGLTVVFAVVRLVQRQTLQFVLGSVLATGLAAFFALRSGDAEDAFLPGILTSCAYLVGSLLSVVLRWPAVGIMVGLADQQAVAAGDPFRWRRNAAAVKVCSRLTLVLVAVYAIRVAIMGPLYLTDNVAGLTISKVVLGWPLWAGAVAVMGAMLLKGHTPIDPDDDLVQPVDVQRG
ncbi:DUF3159 domain-containing protein [Janibacter hoylei]|uniref:DUF3159 domain-containing protein n=1 Tax=Janibacter hoylei PVAS-1 TaxID=1210046 RepID=K1DZL0_9MICO|nr:DUF3159 domain-containing protein [Janibacter hoylei]EKA62060.1 hypothetical protein B277_04307 [Janibacter hoylei PVAS-1]RWU83747.1 DUF3159 domain-containing protein [Janibacter hoylei PVAS-1]